MWSSVAYHISKRGTLAPHYYWWLLVEECWIETLWETQLLQKQPNFQVKFELSALSSAAVGFCTRCKDPCLHVTCAAGWLYCIFISKGLHVDLT